MGKKTLKRLIPKRIAGVKVPKAARKGPFAELLASRSGQILIAEAILGAAAAAAELAVRSRKARRPRKDADSTAWTPDYGAPEPAPAKPRRKKATPPAAAPH